MWPRRRTDRELLDEFETHIALRADDLAARGLSRDDALKQARAEFGAMERYRHLCRRERPRLPLILTGLRPDIVFVSRRLRRSPLYAFFAVVTLALGIGVTSATYSAVFRAFWRPLGVVDEDRLLALGQEGRRGPRTLSPTDLDEVRQGQTSFESLEGTAGFMTALGGLGRSTIVTAEGVTGGYFNTLGPRIILGRGLQPGDDDNGAFAAVISEFAWRSIYGADPSVIGRTIRIADRPFELVGVTGKAFGGVIGMPAPDTSVWIPLSTVSAVSPVYRRRAADPDRLRSTYLYAFGRLRPGKTEATANAEMLAMRRELDRTRPIYRTHQKRSVLAPREFIARPIHMRLRDMDFEIARIILTIPALILLVACTNLTNLVLSRGTSRGHEFAIRRALGASRWRLVREQLIEVGFLAVAGGVTGLALARGLLLYADSLITQTFGYMPRFRLDTSLEPNIVAATLGAVLLAVLVGGLIPALELTRRSYRSRLAVDSPGAAPPKWRGRSNLIALQVTVSLALFLFAGFLVNQLLANARARSGMEPGRAALVAVSLSSQQKPRAEVDRITRRVLEEARADGSLDVVAAGSLWHHDRRAAFGRVMVDGRALPDSLWMGFVTGPIFDVLGLPLLAGRTFDARDDAGASTAVIVNRSFAAQLFGTHRAEGRTLTLRGEIHQLFVPSESLPTINGTVVGVVGDTYDRRGVPERRVYLPLSRGNEPDVEFFARSTSLSARAAAMSLRTAVQKVDPELAVSYAGSADVMDGGLDGRMVRLLIAIAIGLASFALVLSMTGLYGVLSHVIGHRTREFGIRAALGADRADLRNLVLREGLRPVVEGAIIGTGVAVFLNLVAQPMFSKRVATVEWDHLAAAFVPLVIAAAIACYLPARRASRLDPSTCLRSE